MKGSTLGRRIGRCRKIPKQEHDWNLGEAARRPVGLEQDGMGEGKGKVAGETELVDEVQYGGSGHRGF